MIEIGDLQFSYDEGDFSLEIPELKAAQGETVAIVGPSGSGKTTSDRDHLKQQETDRFRGLFLWTLR